MAIESAPVYATLPRHPRYPSLDLWRGVACLIVVVFHASLFCYQSGQLAGLSGWIVAVCARGWIGVPLFFVISGYCISATADAARRRGHPVSRYFIRRFRRIYPPYWAVLACSLVFVYLLYGSGHAHWITGNFEDINAIPHPGSLHPWQWFGNVTLTETWRMHLVPPGSKLLLGHAWTLCYEEQFYAVTGILLLAAPRRFFLGVALVSVAVVACTPLGWAASGFFWDGRWLLFAAGVGVYYALNYADHRGQCIIAALLTAGILHDLCKLNGWLDPPWVFSGMHRNEPLCAYGFALLALALHRFDSAICALKIAPPLLACGRMCYSLYLVHFPIVLALSHAAFLAGLQSSAWTAFLTIPACVGCTLVAGWLFHMTVERRFLNPPT
ncbi:MAG: acyltransferase [Candidatus Hydrogenedentota bacterium]